MTPKNCLFTTPAAYLFLLTALLSGLSSCKKAKKEEAPQNPFSRFEGSWKPTQIYDWNGLKNAPFPSGITYLLWHDSIIYVEMELVNDTSGGTTSREKVNDTLDMDFTVTSRLLDKSLLRIDENYTIYGKSGQVFKQWVYGTEVPLEEGRYTYGTTNNDVKITPDSIKFYYYTWSSVYSATVKSRTIKRL